MNYLAQIEDLDQVSDTQSSGQQQATERIPSNSIALG